MVWQRHASAQVVLHYIHITVQTRYILLLQYIFTRFTYTLHAHYLHITHLTQIIDTVHTPHITVHYTFHTPSSTVCVIYYALFITFGFSALCEITLQRGFGRSKSCKRWDEDLTLSSLYDWSSAPQQQSSTSLLQSLSLHSKQTAKLWKYNITFLLEETWRVIAYINFAVEPDRIEQSSHSSLQKAVKQKSPQEVNVPAECPVQRRCCVDCRLHYNDHEKHQICFHSCWPFEIWFVLVRMCKHPTLLV